MRHSLGGSVRPMRRAERVVDVQIAQSGQLFGESRVVTLFFGVVTQILEQQHLAGLQRPGHPFHLRPDAIRSQRHRLPEQLAQTRRRRSQRHLRHLFTLGSAQM